MTSTYRHLYLSPHFDDAALSCGGQIHRLTAAGQPVLVVTVFAGRPGPALSPFAERLHGRWGNPADANATRLAEDEAAMRILGADYVRLNYLDCIYRASGDGREWYYDDETDLFGQVHPAERHLPHELAATIAGLLPAETPVTVYAPLTVGNHVDHQLVHAAARRLDRPNWSVAFYEDYPYAHWPGALEKALEARGAQAWPRQVIHFGAEDLAAKIESVRAYASQLADLFGGEAAMVDLVAAFAHAAGDGRPAERLWHEPA